MPTVIPPPITKSGYVINIVVRLRHNQYVSEIEGVVEVEKSKLSTF